MKKTLIVMTALGLSFGLAGCNSDNPGDRAVGGAVLGGVAGAVIGGAATGRPGGAVAGGLIGAAGGAIIGGSTAPRQCARFGYDINGNTVCIQYY